VSMPRKKTPEKMVLISFHLPAAHLAAIEELVGLGYFPSVSEAIRAGVRCLLERYGALPIPKVVETPPETVRGGEEEREEEGKKEETICDRFFKLCKEEPWVCLSRALIRERLGESVIYQCAFPKWTYVHGYRSDFIEAAMKDVAAYITSICKKRITVSGGSIAREAGVPAERGVSRFVTAVLSRLPGVPLEGTVKKFTFDCEKLRDFAQNCELETIRYVYYVTKRDYEAIRTSYEKIRLCLSQSL